MNLFVAMAIISFLFLQASCGALLNCESRNAWDREYNVGSVYQKCVNYRDRGKVDGTTEYLDFDGALHNCLGNRTGGSSGLSSEEILQRHDDL